jgi:mitochondrial fission protein ELM1
VSDPIIWVLLGARTGDNNQALALAEALDLPFEVKPLDYNALQSLSVWLPGTAATLTREAKAGLKAPWPDLVIAIGRRSVPVARWIKQQSKGKAKLVRIGHPRIDPNLFDLVVTTRQYPVPPGDNVVLLPVAMSRFVQAPDPTEEERAFLRKVGRFRMVAIGGATKYWRMPGEGIAEAIASADLPHVVAVTSRRTDPMVVEELERCSEAEGVTLVTGSSPRFSVLMDAAEEIYVTGDSVSMISEAVMTGKPVAIIPIEQDEKGRRQLGPAPQERGPDARRRDLRRFWNHLIDEKMVGTIETGPVRAPAVPDPNKIAADAVRKLLDR